MSAPTDDAALLNLALRLSLELGPQWRMPIQAELAKQRPHLTERELDALDAFARSTRDWAHRLIDGAINDQSPTEVEARLRIREAHPWIDDDTFSHLWSQGVYYALK